MAFLVAVGLPLLRRAHHLRPVSKSARKLCVQSSAGSEKNLRGLELLRLDLHRFSRLLRFDSSVLVDTRADFRTYDVNAIYNYYRDRPLSSTLRFLRVAVPFGLWFLQVRVLDRWLYRIPPTEKRAEKLRRLLCWAGPTYIKIGQAIGNRPDIIGTTYSEALTKLVDNVGTFDEEEAVRIICEQLGISSLNDAFVEFDKNAIASASLGQVHKARLRNGDLVAVKVQRPSVQRMAALDVYVLRRAVALAKKRYKLRSDLVGIVDEFATRLWEELDYVQEANNADRFRELYASDNDLIYVPRMYREHSSKRVLTMEWIDGTKAPWFPKEDATRLINVGVQCSLRQLLEFGFLQADPHVGNLLRRDGTNQLVYLDFGMCIAIDEEKRLTLITAIVRLINRDYSNLAKDFVKLGFLPIGTDTKPLEPLLEKAFGDASSSDSVTDLSFSKLTSNLANLASSSPIRIPVYFTLVIRSLTILEGIALQTDSDFKIVDQSYPFVVSKVLTDNSPVLTDALNDVLIDEKTERLRWNRLQAIVSSASNETTTRKKSTSLDSVLASVSDVALERVIDFALSERGAAFRRSLELELTDTIDAMQLALAHRASSLSGGILPAPPDAVDQERVLVGIEAAETLRKLGPMILQKGNGKSQSKSLERRNMLSFQFRQFAKSVTANVADRNIRRALRQVLNYLVNNPKDDIHRR